MDGKGLRCGRISLKEGENLLAGKKFTLGGVIRGNSPPQSCFLLLAANSSPRSPVEYSLVPAQRGFSVHRRVYAAAPGQRGSPLAPSQ